MINYEYYIDFENKSEDALKYCKKIILELKKSKLFYVGISINPEERYNDHFEEKKLKNMFVLASVNTKLKAENVEKKLLKRFDIKNNLNISPGGEGIDDGHEKYYIYIMFY